MKYMFLIYRPEEAVAKRSDEDKKRIQAGHWAMMQEAMKMGVFHAGDALSPITTATTVRTRNGKHLTMDGPFAETKEQLAGYYLLDCKDLDEAIAWAAKIPVDSDGCVEIRPILEVPKPAPASASESFSGVRNG